MPYDLYLEEDTDIDTLVNNVTNFYHWCASRVLTLDRQYAKEIMNCIGAAQANTDKERAMISIAYHCVSLIDVYWVKKENEDIKYKEINLYDNNLNKAVVDLSLRGKMLTVTNKELAQDLSTGGVFPKAWIRTQEGFKLLKDGGREIVRKELLASAVAQCFDFPQVVYRAADYKGEPVTESDIITSKEYSLVTKMAFDVYACNHDIDSLLFIKELDPIGYYGMNIIDYLVGNTDRHQENWGLLIENSSNKSISLYPIMDFNRSFQAYDTLDGAMCLPEFPAIKSQRETAIEAVKKVGLRQIKDTLDIEKSMNKEESNMFRKRLQLLQNIHDVI